MTTPLTYPATIVEPFAASGDKNTIPTAPDATPGHASLDLGFPPITAEKVEYGGVPPSRKDFNGIYNLITQHTAWVAAGGRYKYNSALVTYTGGYQTGAVIVSTDGLTSFRSLIDNNTADPNTPVSIGTSWALDGGALVATSYAGDPNTHVAGYAGTSTKSAPSRVWDTTNKVWWTCTSTGPASGAGRAVWELEATSLNAGFGGTSGGAANVQTLTPAVAMASLIAGRKISFIAGFTNTAALTMNVSGLGAANVFKKSQSGPVACNGGEVVAGVAFTLIYDGTQWQLENPVVTTGTLTVGHIAVFADATGKLADGGPASVAAAPTMLRANTTISKGSFNVDSSGGSFTITLSAAPALDDCVILTDIYGGCPAHPITVSGNGKNFNAVGSGITPSGTFVMNSPDGEWFMFTYNGTEWRVA